MKDFDEIKKNMLKYETVFSSKATFSKSAIRLKEEKEDIRNPFERDIDKIIHSTAYTRYFDKTQVFSSRYNDNISKRMTHVQFVSRASKTIARALNLNEDLCEAIALGHDIGHTPYGHEGEYILDEISKEKLNEVFAHNVQSVRTFLKLENNGKGTNLCIQTLDGIMCHNGELMQDKYYPRQKTKEEFFKEYEDCYKDIANVKKLIPMTLEGCIVRISDIIGYIGKDIEDAIRLNKLKVTDIPNDIREVLGSSNKEIMNTIICDIIENSYNKDYISMSKEVFEKLEKLKKFNYEYIYGKAFTKRQREILKIKFMTLYDIYYEALSLQDVNNDIYISFYNNMDEDYKKNTKIERVVIDFLAGMTDNFFERQYKKYTIK